MHSKENKYSIFGLLIGGVILNMLSGCINEKSPAETEIITEFAEEQTTEEISSEETVVQEPTEESSEKPTNEIVTSQESIDEMSTVSGAAELPTSISGETLVSAEWVGGLNPEYAELLLPAACFVLPQWYIDGAVVKGDFYYKDSHYPFVNDFIYTIYTEPSLDSEKITVEPFAILYPQATDRLHWIYLESDDKNVCGWLPIEYEGIDYLFVPTEGADKRTLDNSFSGPFAQGDRDAYYGELDLEFPLLEGLEEGKVKLLTFQNKEELQAYMEENRELLEGEPAFTERLEYILSSSNYDNEKINVFLFKDRYANPTFAWYEWYFYKEQEKYEEKYVMFQYYRTDTVEEKPAAYFHIPIFPHLSHRLVEDEIIYLSVIQDPYRGE